MEKQYDAFKFFFFKQTPEINRIYNNRDFYLEILLLQNIVLKPYYWNN